MHVNHSFCPHLYCNLLPLLQEDQACMSVLVWDVDIINTGVPCNIAIDHSNADNTPGMYLLDVGAAMKDM